MDVSIKVVVAMLVGLVVLVTLSMMLTSQTSRAEDFIISAI